jgi:hypothetical protein
MSVNLEQRVAALERQIARMQRSQELNAPSGRVWLDDLYGKFTGDPIFQQAMKLGRKYRQSLRPRTPRPKPKR